MDTGLSTNILASADDFYEAYKRCLEGKRTRQEGGTIVSDIVSIPAIVNGSFACELYLKFIGDYKGKEHRLNEIFNSLTEDLKNAILDEKTISDLNKISVRYGHQNFDELFEEMGNTFVEWRYIFEKDHPAGFYGNRINEYLDVLNILLNRLAFVATSLSFNRKS